MRLLGTAILLLLLVSLNCVLGTRLVVDGTPLPPMGRFLSPQEGFWQNADPIGLKPPTSIRLNGLSSPVQVSWDESGIPHLFAENDTDLYRAQGWVVASLRAWQMDFIARAAAGRISELIGEQALDFDRGQRRKGMGIGAEATEKEIMSDPVMAPIMRAYADGVNQYLSSLRYRDLPVEYKLMSYRPEPWTPLRSLYIQQYMVDNLSGWDRDVEDTHAMEFLGTELFDLLFPERPTGVVPTVPTDPSWHWPVDTIPVPKRSNVLAGHSPDDHRSDPTNGSNNWAVAGRLAKNGHPLLANDTHLGLNFPSIWIPVQLTTPEHRVFGFALPGACGVIIGHNEHTAWGVTNAPRDTRDWYRITWTDEHRTNYIFDGEPHAVTYRVETIKVRGEKAVIDSIPITLHGPVMHDGNVEVAGTSLALRWLGHEPNRAQKALYLLNRVQDHADYVEALRYFDAPAQNWVFASTSGTIAVRVQGRFPNKWRGQGRTILDGADPAHRWQRWIPFEHTATQVDPLRGFVSSANQHSVDEYYPYWFYNGHLEYYRNRRINSHLLVPEPMTVESMKVMQHDGYDLKAEEGLQALLPMLDTIAMNLDERDALMQLQLWDRIAHHDEEGPALFQRWMDGIRERLWASLQDHAFPLGEPTIYNTIRILGDSALRVRLDTGLELNALTIVREAFAAMVKERKANGPVLWKELNNARIIHLARIPAFGREFQPVDGAASAINAQRGNHGPSQRLVVELSDPPKAWFQLPGGLSGNPGSVRYDDLMMEWTTDHYREVHFLRSVREGTELGFTNTTFSP